MKSRFYFGFMVGVLLLSLVTVAPPQRLQAAIVRQNHYPIILVHAWLAWGRGQMNGYNVWGGDECDLQQVLTDAGYDTYTPSMGPYSSTWDRACELYAQIKGGRVDYGKAHSKRYRHARYGRTYTAFVPGWGSAVKKVHLIGHCFGGLTTRQLIQLLEKGDASEMAATPPSDLSPLFAGGHSWVSSCTTISTPHDGTSQLDMPLLSKASETDLLIKMISLFAPYVDDDQYDLQLDQWGLAMLPGETMEEFAGRISSVSLAAKGDFSNYDIIPKGISAFNSRVKAQPDVYYFSFANQATCVSDLMGHHRAIISMSPINWTSAEYMGKHVRAASSDAPFPVTSRWWPNDGSVNTISMTGPKVGSSDVIVNYSGIPQAGKWNFLGTFKGLDHFDVVGINFGWYPNYDPANWFLGMAEILGSLPQ